MSEEPAECPLCMEALEIDDHSFFPCTCGYQICRFCWHRIRTDENGLCPACRKQYPEDPAEFKPLTEDELQNIKKERKQKDVQRKQKAAENRKHLANVRVVQRNLVFVVGLSPRLADPEVLKKHEYFGKFGKIHKVVINQSTSYAGSQGPSASAYVTYVKPEDALRAILTVNNVHVEGRTLKTSLGTTKYCSHFLKGSHCQKNDCMYLHELGEEAASFTKDEMQAGKHQEYEQMLIEQFLNAQNSANNHHIANNKIKKSVSPQAIETAEVIPSLMDMTGDIKHTLSNAGPLLPNPVHNHTGGGAANGHAHFNNSNSVWPVLDGASSPAHVNGTKNDHTSNNVSRAQGVGSKLQHRTNTPPGSGGGSSASRAVGNGRQRGSSNSLNSSEENHIQNQINVGSGNRSPTSTPPGDVEKNSPNDQVNHRGLPLPTPSTSQPVSPRAGVSITTSQMTTPNSNTVPIISTQLQQQQHADLSSTVGAIGSNRRPGLQEGNSAQGLSFFEMPNVSLVNHEMADTLPVSTSTDWVEAFGLKNKELPPEDDLGFDPCAESFKGLADLIEKENGMQQQQHLHLLQPAHSRLGSPPQTSYPPHPLSQSPLQNNTLLRSLPPGFSISHIQQQQLQQQHYFRPDISNSKMPDILPQFSLNAQRFAPLHYHSMPLDLHTPQHQHQPQRELYNMKDMQEQLRSMLPNINISFGSIPHQQQQQQQAQQHQLQQVPTSLFSQQSQHLNKSWPLSSSPDSSPWNDPAIVSTSQLTESGSLFPETSAHWLKSLQHLTESDGPSHRLPFVQQFPLGGNGGWPPHTHNPPPGFRAAGLGSQANTDTHQMAEVLQ
ncbi:CCR4-NOT transcription complex subunit 4 isoform X3 [Biomphalaria pfeifferi]|uniref:CCR4-NOT transcription complex subunit 4 n=1 Tax=Biomphalaria pfeifferi TaxID=112525 RepID=A0AAD8FEB2_BIOPF|nr:CCR4-NOT transcription complex subunit 4 isoform X3 [Biomphalaria pfeifferi]